VGTELRSEGGDHGVFEEGIVSLLADKRAKLR
jgi:hypothetical protein